MASNTAISENVPGSQSSFYKQKHSHLFEQNVLSAHFRKNIHYLILLNQFFGKYLERCNELTRFARSKSLQKCWTGVTFGHFIMVFMN